MNFRAGTTISPLIDFILCFFILFLHPLFREDVMVQGSSKQLAVKCQIGKHFISNLRPLFGKLHSFSNTQASVHVP